MAFLQKVILVLGILVALGGVGYYGYVNRAELGILVGQGVVYDSCHLADFDKQKFLDDLKEMAPEFAAKTYSTGKMDITDETGKKIGEKEFTFPAGELLVNLLTDSETEKLIVDPRLVAVLIQMSTGGLDNPDANGFPLNLEIVNTVPQTPSGEEIKLTESDYFVRQISLIKEQLKTKPNLIWSDIQSLGVVKADQNGQQFVKLYRDYFELSPHVCNKD